MSPFGLKNHALNVYLPQCFVAFIAKFMAAAFVTLGPQNKLAKCEHDNEGFFYVL